MSKYIVNNSNSHKKTQMAKRTNDSETN